MEATYVFLVLILFGIHFYNSDAAICGWDNSWYNTSAPSAATNFTETEVPPDASVLDTVCGKGNPFKIRCRTSGNISFEIVYNDTSLHYFAICNAVIGLKCFPWPNIADASCPDFSIQLGCDCPTTSVPVTSGGEGRSSSGPTSGTGNGGSGNGTTSGAGNIASTGSGVGPGNTNITGNGGENGSSNGSGNTGGTGNTGDSGNGSGNTGGTGNAGGIVNGNGAGSTGSSGIQNGRGSSVGNSKALNSSGRNGSARKETNIICVWVFALLNLYRVSM